MSPVAHLRLGTDQVIRRRMPTAQFISGDEKLKLMFDYWQSRRTHGLLPARRDVDILDLRPMVGGIHLLDASASDPSRFVFRVNGSLRIAPPTRYNDTK